MRLLAEALGHRVRYERARTVRIEREHIGVPSEPDADAGGVLVLALEVSPENGDCVFVQSDPALLMRLRVLLAHHLAIARDAGLDGQYSGVEVEMTPAQAAQLPPTRSGRDRHP